MSFKSYREGVPEEEAVGNGQQSSEQVWTVSYVTRIEVHAETWFKAIEAAEKKTGLPRGMLAVEMGSIKGANSGN